MSLEDLFNADPGSEELLAPSIRERTAVIRTSDRIAFKGCRRRWGWQSHLRGNLGSRDTYGALWFGTGIHYAMEDFHGYNVYGHPIKAFKAYAVATGANQRQQKLPPDVDDLIPLGVGMMEYYGDFWLRNRQPLQTYKHNGIYQVEVNAVVEIELKLFPRWLRELYDHVYYSATFDRVIEDENGLLWIVDYKTCKRMETNHLQIDPQVSAYCWLGQHIYGRPVAGVIYMSLRKALPDLPRILKNGTISTNKQQLTTHSLYRMMLVKMYGNDLAKWPLLNVDMLNYLAKEESPEADHFIRRDRVSRNDRAFEAEGVKILMEIEDMLDPSLKLYPNPSRFHCGWCPFQAACISIDDGSDWEQELQMQFQPRGQKVDTWRQFLPPPDHLQLSQPKLEIPFM